MISVPFILLVLCFGVLLKMLCPDYTFTWPKARYVPVIEHYARARSCYIYTLAPRRYRWSACLAVKLWAALVEGDCAWYIVSPHIASEMAIQYRNWLGDNRVGG